MRIKPARSEAVDNPKSDEDHPMQDLYQNYVADLNQLRAAFHAELVVTAGDLSKAMNIYAQSSEAALSVVAHCP